MLKRPVAYIALPKRGRDRPADRSRTTGWCSYMRRVMSASRRVRKTGAVPVLGFTRAKSAGARAKPRSGSSIVGCRGGRRHTLGLVETPVLAAEYQGAELERGVDVLEEDLSVLEVEQSGDASLGRDGLEEGGGGLVGVDAGRREQTDESIRIDEALCTLNK